MLFEGWVTLTGSDPAIDSSKPCSSFRSAASSGLVQMPGFHFGIAATLFNCRMGHRDFSFTVNSETPHWFISFHAPSASIFWLWLIPVKRTIVTLEEIAFEC